MNDAFNRIAYFLLLVAVGYISYTVFQDQPALTEKIVVEDAIARLDSSIVAQQAELQTLLEVSPEDTVKITQINNSIFYSAGQRDLLKLYIGDTFTIRKP